MVTDGTLVFFIASGIFLAIGELLAYFDTLPDNTLSERIRAWARVTHARKALLAGGLLLLFSHLAFGWPW